MDNKNFYEEFDWSKFNDAEINIKIIKEFIPENVRSIIDVGCGNGLITNELNKVYDVTGVDRSENALKFVTAKKILSSCDEIPVEESSFDLVLSSELLEHLPDDIFEKTINEFQRISKDYILISVPFKESLIKGIIECEKCSYRYHRNLHMRTFDENYFKSKFKNYEVIKSKSFGLKVRAYNPYIGKIKQKISKPISWIPKYWTKNETRSSLCPKCEHKFNYGFKFNLFAFFCDMLNVVISPKIPYWYIILLKKK